MPLPVPSFNHAKAWYDYWYVKERKQICICHKWIQPATCRYYSEPEIIRLIEYHKFNPFLQPIYQEALKHFPKEEQHEQQ